jgi:class 3 adenylate cyclase
VLIGRGEDVDLRLDWDPSVSSIHAEVSHRGSHWVISDEGMSRNGTFVNNERIGGRRRLRSGDVVRVGHTNLEFNEPGQNQRGVTTAIDTGARTGVVTFVFTDLVGSTELLDRHGDDVGDDLIREHLAILRRAIGRCDGEEVKNLGDGLMVAFPSALSAVACAVMMQHDISTQDAASAGEAVGLRIGLNAGEVVTFEGDYFGTPVVVAKRLCDRAAPGQTLVSDVVRALVGSRGGHRFTSLGAMELKGLSEPVDTFELSSHERG